MKNTNVKYIKSRDLILRKKRDDWYIDTGEGCSKIKNKFGTLAEARNYVVKHDLHGCWWDYVDKSKPQKISKKVSITKIEEGEYFVNKRGLIIWRDDEGQWNVDAGEGCKSPKKEFKTIKEAKEYIEGHGLSGCLGGI